MQLEAVTVPQLSHSTVQHVLEVNQVILQILVEFQNNGWLEEPEFQIYQQRLSRNLTFLATVADAVMKQLPMPNLEALDATPLAVPQKFKTNPKLDAKIAACIEKVHSLGAKAPQETSKGLSHGGVDRPSSLAGTSEAGNTGLSEDCVPPPAMVQDPNASSVSHPSPYVPVQPFVLPSNASLPPGQDLEIPYLEPQTADNVLKHRLQSADKERSAPSVKRLATGPEVGKIPEVSKQGTTSNSNSVNMRQSETLPNNSAVQDAPLALSPTKDDEEEEDGEYIPPIEEEEEEEDREDDAEEHQEGGGGGRGLTRGYS